MKTETRIQPKKCPRCGNVYREHSSLSRADNKTLICPDCGTREALESIGVSQEEQDMILETIHQHTANTEG